MKKLIITSDSGCDIGTFENSDIPTKMISSYIISNSGDQYKDIIEINNEKIYQMAKEGEKFKTSAPNVEDFEKFFSELLKEYELKMDSVRTIMNSSGVIPSLILSNL